MTSSYRPRPGSVAAKALAYLRMQPEGTALRTKTLARVSGADVAALKTFLVPAVKNGAILNIRAPGSFFSHWALPGAAVYIPEDMERKDIEPRPHAAANGFPSTVPTSVFELASKPLVCIGRMPA